MSRWFWNSWRDGSGDVVGIVDENAESVLRADKRDSGALVLRFGDGARELVRSAPELLEALDALANHGGCDDYYCGCGCDDEVRAAARALVERVRASMT